MTPRQTNDETIGLDDFNEVMERFKGEYWKNHETLAPTYMYLMEPYDEEESDEDFYLKWDEAKMMMNDLDTLRKAGFK